MQGQPAITLTLYGLDDEKIKTYERGIIPWGILKKATRLAKLIEDKESEMSGEAKPQVQKWWFFARDKPDPAANTEEKQMEAISQFVVDLFGNQFTIKELENGADVGEIMTVFHTVLNRASATVQLNPTMLQSLKKGKRKE
jgi:hypothetical protein